MKSPGIPGCNATAGTDCLLQIGIPFNSSRFVQGTGVSADCIADTLTGLMWDNNPSSTTYSWDDAVALNTSGGAIPASLCGYSDWRLPNINELASLLNYGDANSVSNYLNNNGFNILSAPYWSSSVYSLTGGGDYWIGYFTDGSIVPSFFYTGKTVNNNNYVLPVRGGENLISLPATVAQIPQTGQNESTNGCDAVVGADCTLKSGAIWPNPRFSKVTTTNGICITDNLTGLMWAQNANLFNGAIDWNTALIDVAQMNVDPTATGGYLCGYTDWRLPNINELRSLVNYGQTYPASWLNNSTQGFINVANGLRSSYWSSSLYLYGGSNNSIYWSIYFIDGSMIHNGIGYIWPVRGGFGQ